MRTQQTQTSMRAAASRTLRVPFARKRACVALCSALACGVAMLVFPRALAAQVPPPPASYGGSATVVVPVLAPEYGAAGASPAPQPRLVTEEESSSIKGLWLPGMIVLPIAWIITWSTASAAFPESEAASLAWIPVIGPWLMLGSDINGGEGYIALSGIVQGLAAVALVLGLSIRRTRTVQRYVIDPPGGGAPITVSFGAGPMRDGGAAWGQLSF